MANQYEDEANDHGDENDIDELMAKVWQEGIKTYIFILIYDIYNRTTPDPVVWQTDKGSTDFLAARINSVVGSGASISLNEGGGGVFTK